MDYLGGSNLFTSHFIMGTMLPTDNRIQVVNFMNGWMFYKDNTPSMRKYRSDRTQYIDFLHIIELSYLEEILHDLIRIYRKSYPYSEKSDFFEHIFGSTLWELQKYIDESNYIYYGVSVNNSYTFYFMPPYQNFEVYYVFDRIDDEYIDFIVEPTKSISYYKQYYKKVLQLINDIDYSVDNKTEKKEEKSNQDRLWFKVGVYFAEGKIPLVQKDIPISSTHLAKHLGNKNYRPYITDSVSDINKNSDKNIFNYPNKLIEIKDYCNESRIEICESFLKKIDSIIGD